VERADRTEPTLTAESSEATDRNEPTDRTEPADPMDSREPEDPIDRIEPVEPMDRIDPLEPIDMIDPDEPRLWIEPDEPRLRSERSTALVMSPLWQPGPQSAALRLARPSTKMSMSISNRSSGSEKANSPASAIMFGNCPGGSEAM
jgi:hypothetical protein